MFKIILLSAAMVYVTDGDTLRVDRQPYRLVGFNTPEIHGQCDYETKLALDAKARMAQLVKTPGARLEQVPCAGNRLTDKYGRFCAKVFAMGADVAETMIASGLAEPYTCPKGRCERRKDWCH